METEVQYPQIEGEFHPVSLSPDGFPEYLRYIIRFFTIGAGIVVFGALVYGGFLWMTSGGEPLKLQKSRSRLISAFAGLVIVIASYMLLSSINPTLVELQEIDITKAEDTNSPGIFLSLTGSFEETDDIRRINSSERGLGSLEGRIESIRIINPTEDGRIDGPITYRYVVVLHSDENFQGKCKFFINNSSGGRDISINEIKEDISSISIIRARKYDEGAYGMVEAYDKPEFQAGSNSQILSTTTVESFSSLNVEPWSIDIEGRHAIILASGSSWEEMTDGCAVFSSSRPITTLVNHPMNRCSPYFFSEFFAAYRSCATHYATFPLYTR